MGGAEGFGLIKGKDMTLGGSNTQVLLGGAWKELHVGEAPPSRGLCQVYDGGSILRGGEDHGPSWREGGAGEGLVCLGDVTAYRVSLGQTQKDNSDFGSYPTSR